MSTGQQQPPGGIQVSLGQVLPTLIILAALWVGYQGYRYLAAHLRWVTPDVPSPVKPDVPKPDPKPTPRPFPSTGLIRRAPFHAG